MNWDNVREEWETSKITLKDLAAKHNIKPGTLKSRKSREKWSRGATQKDATNYKKVATPKMIIESDELNDKQQMFCLYYLEYFNATKAYMKAYDCAYSTAMVEGHKHLKKPKIDSKIDRMKEEQTNELKLNIRDVLQKYIDIAFADINDFMTYGQKEIEYIDDLGRKQKTMVNYVDFNNSDQVDGTIISEVKQGKDGVAIKLADKMKALDKLDKYFEMLPESTKEKVQLEKIKHDMVMKEKEVELKQQEIDKKNTQPDMPDITQYLEALKGEIKDVFDDE